MTTSQTRTIPSVTAEQMLEVDRLMVERYGIGLLQMMENAGRHLARLAVDRFLGADPVGGRVVVLAGSGGNGGGALVAARRLRSWGVRVEVFLSRPSRDLTGVPAHQAALAREVGCVVHERGAPTGEPELVLDGLVGYSLAGALRGRAEELARWTQGVGAPTLALDVPSGVDATTGVAGGTAVRAAATLTLALPKTGLLSEVGAASAGDLYLADIGVPPELYATLGLAVGPLFARGEIIRLT